MIALISTKPICVFLRPRSGYIGAVHDPPRSLSWFLQSTGAKTRYLYNCRAVLVCCGQLLLFVVKRGSLVASRTVTSVVLLLKKYAFDLLVAYVSVQCIKAFNSQ